MLHLTANVRGWNRATFRGFMAAKVGFIGLGIIGGAMAQNLLSAGVELHVYNRSPEKARALKQGGAHCWQCPAEVAAHAELLCLCLTDESAVEEVIFGEAGIEQTVRYNSLIIDFSTISPAAARSIAQRLKELKVQYLDAPVSGGDVGARDGTLTVMAGGESEAFERAREVLEIVGRRVVHTGGSGSGQLTKAVNQIVVGLTVAAMTEGLTFAAEAGLDVETTLRTISGGAAGSWTLENYAPRVLRGDLAPGFKARDMLKDLRIAVTEADRLELALPVLELVKSLYTGLCSRERSKGELGNHALIELYRKGLSAHHSGD